MAQNLLTGEEIRKPQNLITGEPIEGETSSLIERGINVVRTVSDVQETAGRGAVRGIPIIGPSIERGLERAGASLFGVPIEEVRERGEKLREEFPAVNTLSEIAGSFAALSPVVGAAPRLFGVAGPFASRLAAGTGTGAVIGAADTAARGGDPVTGALFGAGGGAAGTLIGGMLGRTFARHESTPSAEALRKQAAPLFDKARDNGLVVKGDRFQPMLRKLENTLNNEGLDSQLHPRVTRALARLKELDEQDIVDLKALWTRHRIIGGLAKSPEADERRLAAIMADEFDGFLSGLKQTDVTAGDPEVISTTLNKARDLWKRSIRAQILEDAVERADLGTGAQDPALAIRTAFRGIANNGKKMRQFTPEQQAQIRKVAKGGEIQELVGFVNSLHGAAVGAGFAGGLVFVDPVLGAVAGIGVLGVRQAGRSLRASEARNLVEGARQLATQGTMIPMTPSARARAFGSAVGLTTGITLPQEEANQ